MIKIYKKIGPHSSYCVDDDIEYLKEEGYLKDPSLEIVVRNIFTKYGGIKYIFDHAIVPRVTDWLRIHGWKTSMNIDPGWVIEDYSERVGHELCVIGEAWRGYMVLSVDKFAHIYAGCDNHLIYVGDNIEIALDNIRSNKHDYKVIGELK